MSDPNNHPAHRSNRPTAKVTAGAVAGAIATISAWLLSVNGVEMPAGVEAAFATIVAFVLAWLTPEQDPTEL